MGHDKGNKKVVQLSNLFETSGIRKHICFFLVSYKEYGKQKGQTPIGES